MTVIINEIGKQTVTNSVFLDLESLFVSEKYSDVMLNDWKFIDWGQTDATVEIAI